MNSYTIDDFQKMIFIYNALLTGWTVKQKGVQTFQFKRRKDKQEINLDNDIKRFVENNLTINDVN